MFSNKISCLKEDLKRQIRFFIALKEGNNEYYNNVADILIEGNNSLLITIEKIELGMISITDNMILKIEEVIENNKKILNEKQHNNKKKLIYK